MAGIADDAELGGECTNGHGWSLKSDWLAKSVDQYYQGYSSLWAPRSGAGEPALRQCPLHAEECGDVPASPTTVTEQLRIRRCARKPMHAALGAGLLLIAATSARSALQSRGANFTQVPQVLDSNVEAEERCCTSETAECLACASWMSVPEFCATKGNEKVLGCQDACCTDMTAACLSCAANVRVEDFCALEANQHVPGCGPSTATTAPKATPALAAHATAADGTMPAVIATNGTVASTTKAPCCAEKTAECLACAAAMPVQKFCALAANRRVTGCEVSLVGAAPLIASESVTEVPLDPEAELVKELENGIGPDCCEDQTASCLACMAKQPLATFCLQHQNVSGCRGGCALIEDDYDYPGGDLYSIPMVNLAEDCCGRCRLEPRCTSWTWGEPTGPFAYMCFLKAQPEMKRNPRQGVRSGVPLRESQTFLIKNRGGLCLQWWLNGNVTLEECSSEPIEQQRWTFDFQTGRIKSWQGLCLDEPDREQEATQAVVRPCVDGTLTQNWAYDSISGRASNIFGVCLTAPLRLVSGSQAAVAPCDQESDDQHWSFWDSKVLGAPETISAMNVEEAQLTHTTTTTTLAPTGTLYCFSVMTPWGYEPELVAMQAAQRISIFQCEGFAVYSSQVRDLGNGIVTKFVDVDLRCPIGGPYNTALNTYIFVKVWRQVITDAEYLKYDWVVKVDADAVFLPERLRNVVLPYNARAQQNFGVFLNNCKYGLHGPIEVVSRRALEVFAEGSEDCNRPLQEDVYLQSCLLMLGVNQINQFSVLDEDHCKSLTWATCKANYTAFHPFKSIASYQECRANALQQVWSRLA